jgi:hypothetical protein
MVNMSGFFTTYLIRLKKKRHNLEAKVPPDLSTLIFSIWRILMFTRSTLILCSIGLALALTTQMAAASPFLDITSPPVFNGGNTGPANDPSASQGQWFQDVAGFNGNEPIPGTTVTNRTQEFYDNQTGNGGGSASTNAITGIILANSLTYDGNGLVTGFTIHATITNDLLSTQGSWLDGANSHSETLSTLSSVKDLYNVKLTTEFADDGKQGNFPTSGAPYFGPQSNIFAKNYDELAWYSNTATGAYQVPTYDFGTILLGQSVSRDLQFGLYNPVAQATIQFLIGPDIFMNRTTDLKLGDYFENGPGNVDAAGVRYQGLAVDDGSAYPNTLNRSGNVSVFVTPEPTSLALMVAGLAGLAATGRRKKA